MWLFLMRRPTGLLHRIAGELLDAEADALLLDVDVEHLGLDHVAFLVVGDGLLARLVPGQIGEMHHAVDVVVETDEQSELGDALDLALDGAARRMRRGKRLPRIVHASA